MFNNKPDNEDDFCESYKSQILNNNSNESESSLTTILKTLIIILLLTLIVGLSVYGYKYLMKKPMITEQTSLTPSSMQISDDELKVTLEEPTESKTVLKTITQPVEKKTLEVMPTSIQQEEPKKEKVSEVINIPIPASTQTGESDIDQIANALKLSIAASEEKKIDIINEKMNEETLSGIQSKVVEEKSLEVPLSVSPEAKYLEELAELSNEIDKEMKHK